MAKKKKEKVQLIETIQFQDLKQAKRAVSMAKINQLRILIGFLIAVGATCITLTSLKNGTEMWVAGFFLGFLAYLVGGGIGRAVKTVWKLAKVGWFLIPIFPIDLLFGFAFLVLGLYGLMFLPVIFVGLNFVQHKKTLDAAKRYLAECRHNAAMAEE